MFLEKTKEYLVVRREMLIFATKSSSSDFVATSFALLQSTKKKTKISYRYEETPSRPPPTRAHDGTGV